jgi:predicted HicB family RNase H-like nuclease
MRTVEAAVEAQVGLTGDDPAIAAASRSLLAVLRPALREAALDLASQAALEVGAQLPSSNVEVVLVDGEPSLRVTDQEIRTPETDDEEFAARITVRLPPSVKHLVEEAASESGDSINSWVIKALSSRGHKVRSGRQVRETFDL